MLKHFGHPHIAPQLQYHLGILIFIQHKSLNNHFPLKNNLLFNLFVLLDHNSMFFPQHKSQAAA